MRDQQASPLRCEQIARVVSGEPAKVEGDELLYRCAHPERHLNGDLHPSLKINQRKNVWSCFPCRASGTAWALAAFLAGLDPNNKPAVTAWLCGRGLLDGKNHRNNKDRPPPEHCNTATLTLSQYAEAKKLPLDFLRNLGISDTKYRGAAAVRIPYRDKNGAEVAVRFRRALDGDNRFLWSKGSKSILYGAWQALAQPDHILCEGESDCHTLWYHGFPALGLPGAGDWNEERDAGHLVGAKKIYVVVEPDTGGAAVLRWLGKSKIRERAFLINLDGCKDPSALYLSDPPRFAERFKHAMGTAVPFSEVLARQVAINKDKLWDRCKHIATLPDILRGVEEAIRTRNVVGEARNTRLLYLSVTTRFLGRPVSIAVKGPSSGGKSFLVEQVLRLFPDSAVYILTAMSERALVYTDADLQHKFLVLLEAAGLSGEFSSYLIRSLLSEGRLVYEVVEKTPTGFKPRRIEKKGPTGLLLTTTAVKLHPENETRLLSVRVTDTNEQTKAVLRAIAEGPSTPTDEDGWKAFQEWLALGDHRVVVPFATRLAECIPPIAVRLRRDFGALLSLVKTHAILHQTSRQRDPQGCLVATLEDYVVVRGLVVDILSEGIDATVGPTLRETVEAVRNFTGARVKTVSITQLARELNLDKSATSRRVREALDLGYLRNLAKRKGLPARLVAGDPLPESIEVLPDAEVLQCCTQNGQAHPTHNPIGIEGVGDREDEIASFRVEGEL